MKSLFVLLALSLCAISSHASEVHKMDQVDLKVLNDIVGAIKRTKEAATFAKNVRFDSVSAEFSADEKKSIIEAKGLLIVGGDMACGDLRLRIERTIHFNGWESSISYKAILDKSDLQPESFCAIRE